MSYGDFEVVVSTGDTSAEINAAITTVNANGGGWIRFAGMLEMDDDIVMKSNVQLVGFGPGSGIVNSTATAYTIDFQGTGTNYGITNYTTGVERFTCDTAAEASNFTAGDKVLIKDATTTLRYSRSNLVKADGVPGTGLVTLYAQNDAPNFNAASTAMPMGTAVQKAGMKFLEVKNTGAGSLEIDCDIACDLKFSDVTFNQVWVSTGEVCDMIFDHCLFTVIDTVALAQHIEVKDWSNKLTFLSCEFIGSDNAIYIKCSNACWWLTAEACRFTGVTRAIFIVADAGLSARREQIHMKDCYVIGHETPDADGGNGQMWYSTNAVHNFSITGCVCNGSNSKPPALYAYTSTDNRPMKGVISGNSFFESTGTLEWPKEVTFSNNVFGNNSGWTFTEGPEECTITGNTHMSSLILDDGGEWPVQNNIVSDNYVVGAITIRSTATDPSARNVISNNHCTSMVIEEEGVDDIINGNFIDGNVSIGGGDNDRDNLIFSNNHVDGNVSFTSTTQNYVIMIGNLTDGTLQTPDNANCQIANNQEY